MLHCHRRKLESHESKCVAQRSNLVHIFVSTITEAAAFFLIIHPLHYTSSGKKDNRLFLKEIRDTKGYAFSLLFMSRPSLSKSSQDLLCGQQLIYSQGSQKYRDSALPSYTTTEKSAEKSIENSTGSLIPLPNLIDELFGISISALDELGETKSRSEDDGLGIQRHASWWACNIMVFQVHYSEIEHNCSAEQVMALGGCNHLYAGTFRYLSEAIFHACEFPVHSQWYRCSWSNSAKVRSDTRNRR